MAIEFDLDADRPLMAAPVDAPRTTEAFGVWLYDPSNDVGLHIHLINEPGHARVRERLVLYLPDGRILLYGYWLGASRTGARRSGRGARALFGCDAVRAMALPLGGCGGRVLSG